MTPAILATENAGMHVIPSQPGAMLSRTAQIEVLVSQAANLSTAMEVYKPQLYDVG